MKNENATSIGIVEDDNAIRAMLTDLFSSEPNFNLISVHADAEDAMAQLLDSRPEVVIMDVNLPGKNGIDCVATLKKQNCSSQFLMYTVYDDDHKVFDALKAGANGYILKSSSPQQIIDAVIELKNGGAPMSAHVARRVVNQFRSDKPENKDVEVLSDRENEVLSLLALGLLYKEIADKLGISEGTVKQHIHRIYAKMHVQNRTEAVNRYFGR